MTGTAWQGLHGRACMLPAYYSAEGPPYCSSLSKSYKDRSRYADQSGSPTGAEMVFSVSALSSLVTTNQQALRWYFRSCSIYNSNIQRPLKWYFQSCNICNSYSQKAWGIVPFLVSVTVRSVSYWGTFPFLLSMHQSQPTGIEVVFNTCYQSQLISTRDFQYCCANSFLYQLAMM